ncbi:LOW QUALITY PROTEIN: protein delta homolog 1 [Syngnathoides biaculeatus]|uniref:LOW QUALITY PROTEIN: protein delta homolog 1 n=1 Tax=Syngnathoides biaculeatus TaxID=300417 RepID=UPI002ADDC030|nr:LOW QUALITY PROTEIN: protein delta homolog 1 [Syngnathoides biaculeatus]
MQQPRQNLWEPPTSPPTPRPPPHRPLHLEQPCYHFYLRTPARGALSPNASVKYESHHPDAARRCHIGIYSRTAVTMRLTAVFLFAAVTGVAGGWGCGCNTENGFCGKTGKCRCKPGWQGDHCERCIPFPGCLHGSCEKAWQCVCQQGWLGSLCDQDNRLCSSGPCSGNATCIETGEGGYLCVCPQGFTGPTCQLRRNVCLTDGSPCQNGGTCTEAGDGSEVRASCSCPPGFSGNVCQIASDVCQSDPCLNGGNCTNRGATFTCSCLRGFSGMTCNDTVVSPCGATPCANGAACVGRPDGTFRCVCPKRFSGQLCAIPHRPKAKPKQAKPADRRVFALTPQHYSLPTHAFHKLLQAPERDLLKITLKETARHSPGVLSGHAQLVCFGMLALLTCLVILATTGIVLCGRCEAWLANAKYSKLVRRQRDHLLKEAGAAGREETEHSVNIILPEKIRLNSFGRRYTSI